MNVLRAIVVEYRAELLAASAVVGGLIGYSLGL